MKSGNAAIFLLLLSMHAFGRSENASVPIGQNATCATALLGKTQNWISRLQNWYTLQFNGYVHERPLFNDWSGQSSFIYLSSYETFLREDIGLLLNSTDGDHWIDVGAGSAVAARQLYEILMQQEKARPHVTLLGYKKPRSRALRDFLERNSNAVKYIEGDIALTGLEDSGRKWSKISGIKVTWANDPNWSSQINFV